MERNYDVDTVGLDVSQEMLSLGRRKNPQGSYVRGHMRDCSFDAVWCQATVFFVSVDGMIQSLQEIQRVLSDDGFALISFKESDTLSAKSESIERFNGEITQ